MVADTLNSRSGTRLRSRRTTVDFPTAEGPASTTSRPLRVVEPLSDTVCASATTGCSGVEVEPGEQRLALTVAQAAQAARRGDLEFGHDLLRLDLADLRQGLEQGGHLHLAEDLVVLGIGQDLLEVGAAALQAVLELSPGATGSSRLLQSSGALLVGQLGKGHGSSVSSLAISLIRRLTSGDSDRTHAGRRLRTHPPAFRLENTCGSAPAAWPAGRSGPGT
ncbi:hypothetical protein RHRU231_400008 [Rhodococcus ruber]|uniref:Uncharacterized protein n=1 Tax=Rhodococcus ruber TaxID=1830 RepID=A0A098BKX0_9NOCA|nr:hypothetical protein RHRU231_400008 [Rhodococcus ruber]